MRFWQAAVIAQMAAGAVWADRFTGNWQLHLLADAGSIAFGASSWIVWKWVFCTTPEEQRGEGNG